jgi:hypothetical protein
MRSGATFVAILAALAIMTCALWLPFGWRVTGTFEEWDVVGKADRLGTLSQLFVYPINRPLFQAPMVIAHWLTPGSFLGMNVIQALLIFGASAALYCLVLELMPANRALAFVTAALLLVYPADDASYTLRATNIHAGTLSLLIALCLLTASLRKTTPPRIIAMIAMEALSLAIYDGGLLIALCSPWLILLCTQCKITRRTSLVSLAWLAVPAFFAYALWRAVRDPGTYQGSLIRSAGLGHDYSHTAYVLAQSIWRALTHNFWSGWIHATTLPTADDPYLRIAVALALFAFAPLVWTLYGRTQKPRSVVTDARYWMLAAAGVAIVVMGFAMFLPTTWRDTNWRVFLYSSIGASLTVTVVCWIAASVFQSGSRAVFVVLSGALFTVGGVHALEQHGLYFAQTQRQQEILAGIVASAPKVASPVSFLLVDQTPSAAFKAWSMCTSIGDCLEDQLRYVYHGVDLRAAYCAPHFRSRGDSSEECEFGPDGVTVSYTYLGNGKPVHKHFPYGALLIFVDEPTGVRLIDDLRDVAPAEVAGTYDPKAIVDASAPPPQRVHALFTRWPFKPTYPRRREVPSYRFDFDRPAPGDGWSVPEGSHMWTDDPEATLDLWLRRGTDYRMEWRIIAAMAPDILSSLHVKVNGHPLQVEVHPDAGGAVTYVATIPAADVATDPLGTRIAFTVDRVVTPKSLGMNNDERTLGVMFDWIRIDPSTSD